MESFIKSTFFLVLLVAVFNIGLSNAYADEVKAPETNQIENVDAVPPQCSSSSLTYATMLFSYNIATNFMDKCQPGVIVLENDTVILIFPDCTIVIDDQDGDEPVVIKA